MWSTLFLQAIFIWWCSLFQIAARAHNLNRSSSTYLNFLFFTKSTYPNFFFTQSSTYLNFFFKVDKVIRFPYPFVQHFEALFVNKLEISSWCLLNISLWVYMCIFVSLCEYICMYSCLFVSIYVPCFRVNKQPNRTVWAASLSTLPVGFSQLHTLVLVRRLLSKSLRLHKWKAQETVTNRTGFARAGMRECTFSKVRFLNRHLSNRLHDRDGPVQ